MAHFNTLMPRVIDRVWDAALKAKDGPPANLEISEANYVASLGDAVGKATLKERRRTNPKLAQGQARKAVLTVIQQFAETGISRAQIREKVRPLLNGRDMSPNTLKRALFDLSQSRTIFTLNSRWHPADSTVLGPGRVLTVGPPPDPKPHRYRDGRE